MDLDQKCSWPFIEKEEPDVIQGYCERKAYIVYEKDGKTYPRCPRHAQSASIISARSQGFVIHYLNPEAGERP